jgi:hypothetical protein
MEEYTESTKQFIDAVRTIYNYGKGLPDRYFRIRTPRTPDHYYNRKHQRGRFNTLAVPTYVEEAAETVYRLYRECLEECMLDSSVIFREAFIRLPEAFGEVEEISVFKLPRNLRYRVLKIGKFELIVLDDVYDSAPDDYLMAS